MIKRDVVQAQYRKANNLEKRIQIYSFSVSGVDWHRWVYELLDIQPNMKVFEVGCGNAALWKKNQRHLPAAASLVLTDQSPGMIESAKKAIGMDSRFSYAVLDIEDTTEIPDVYDRVIANHMLYHVNAKDAVLRVLAKATRASGFLCASTNSLYHLSELNEILHHLSPGLALPAIARDFNVENGREVLGKHFSTVEYHGFENVMRIPEPRPLIDFVLSIFNGNGYPDLSERVADLERAIVDNMVNGFVTVTGRSGLFICGE